MGFSHEDIETLIKEKDLKNLKMLQDETYIGTVCGKCLPILDELFDDNSQ